MNASFKLLTVSLVLGAAVWACGSDNEGTPTGTPEGSSGSGGSAAGEPGMTDGGKVGTAGSATSGTAGMTMAQGGASDGGASTMPIGGDSSTAMGGDASTTMGGDAATTMGGDASVPVGGMSGDGGAGGQPAAVPSCKGTVPVCSTLSSGQCLTVSGCAIADKCTGNPVACDTHLSKPECAQAQGCDNGQSCTGTPTPCAERAGAIACDDGCKFVPCGGTATACAGLDQTACGLQSGCSWK